jgi:hypothetical protein
MWEIPGGLNPLNHHFHWGGRNISFFEEGINMFCILLINAQHLLQLCPIERDRSRVKPEKKKFFNGSQGYLKIRITVGSFCKPNIQRLK